MRLFSSFSAFALWLVVLLSASLGSAQERVQPPSLETRELAARSLRGPRACIGTGAALLALGPAVLLTGAYVAAAGADGHQGKLHPAAIAVGASAMGIGVGLLIFGIERAKDVRAARNEVRRFQAADLALLPGGAYLSARATF